MTLHVSDLILIVAIVAAATGACYLLLLRKLMLLFAGRRLEFAEQLGALNDAIQALETRFALHSGAASSNGVRQVEYEPDRDSAIEESEGTAPEIKAAIAAAAIAALGPNAHVTSIKPAGQPSTSPWTQQGRVMVQGSHNLRARR